MEEELARLRGENAALKKQAAASSQPEDGGGDSWGAAVEDDWVKRQAALESWVAGEAGAHYQDGATLWHPQQPLSLDQTAVVWQAVRDLHENGFAIVEGFLSDEQIQRVRDGMAPQFDDVRKLFEVMSGELYKSDDPAAGRQTRHLQNVLAKTRAADEVAAHPVLRAIVAGTLSPDFVMNAAAVAMNPDPGCAKQGLHQDDGFFPLPRPRMPMVVTVAVALDDFYPANGSTQIVPGSHTWGFSQLGNGWDTSGRPDIKQFTMPAGSMLLWDGAVLHGGGANTTQEASRRTVTLNYTRGWCRTQFNQYLSVPREVVLALPPELQHDLGMHHSVGVPGWLQGGLGGVDTQDALHYL
jgi:ectoine hydroxylase-related dioxygenase (phytanoyl-CoA dioxygenase family)